MLGSVVFGVVQYKRLNNIGKALLWYVGITLFIDLFFSIAPLERKVEEIGVAYFKWLSRIVNYLSLLIVVTCSIRKKKIMLGIGLLIGLGYFWELYQIINQVTVFNTVPYATIVGYSYLALLCVLNIIYFLQQPEMLFHQLFASCSILFYTIFLSVFFIIQIYVVNQLTHNSTMMYFYFSYILIVLVFQILIFIQLWKDGKTQAPYLR